MKMVNQDDEHLRLLSILYYVKGGLAAFGACIGLGVAVVAGGAFTAAAQSHNGPPVFLGPMIFAIIGFGTLLAGAVAALTIWTGRNLAQRKRYTFCFVMAVILCVVSIPLGTALGIFTIIVLQRPSVKNLFEGVPAPA